MEEYLNKIKELIKQYNSLKINISNFEEEEQRINAVCSDANRKVSELEKKENRLNNNSKYLLRKKLKTLTVILSIIISVLVFGISSICWSLDYAIFFGVPLSLGSAFLSYLGLSLYNLLRQEDKNIFKKYFSKKKEFKNLENQINSNKNQLEEARASSIRFTSNYQNICSELENKRNELSEIASNINLLINTNDETINVEEDEFIRRFLEEFNTKKTPTFKPSRRWKRIKLKEEELNMNNY